MTFDSRQLTALTAYAERVGAVETGLLRYVVREEGEGRYPRNLATIKVSRAGEVKVSGTVPSPTDAEAKVIAAEVSSADLPRRTPARSTAGLREAITCINGEAGMLYSFLSLEGDGVLFVEQRIGSGLDGKRCLPWTFWSDGEWRRLEPDLLPLWGLERLGNASAVMIHEGAKSAAKVRELVDEARECQRLGEPPPNHPWLAELVEYEHLGWAGGALRPLATDWEPIRNLPEFVNVVLVADHDHFSENAAPVISKRLGRRVEVLRFDNRFPPAFDLADDFPRSLWRGDRYIGPPFEDCLEPATWATRQLATKAKGRPAYELTDAFAAEWLWTVTPAVFVHRHRLRWCYNEQEFNAAVAPFSDVDNTARLVRRRLSCKAERLVYEPAEPPGVIAKEREHVINVYQPSDIKPDHGAGSWDALPWIDFLVGLIPEPEDRLHLAQWCATLIARPSIRMKYGVLLVSETQGIGKSTLADRILAPLIGMSNVSNPTSMQITEGRFSSWLIFKRLVSVAELYDGNSSKGYNRLKQIITDPVIDVEEKFQKAFTLSNKSHIFATSNSLRALKMSECDRRWLVPKCTEDKRPPEYWRWLNRWIDTVGLPIIAAWAERFVKDRGPVEVGAEAPMTAAKGEMILAGYSDGERLVHHLGEALGNLEEPAIMRLDELRAWLAGEKSGQGKYGDGTKMLERPETISRVLRTSGLFTSLDQFHADGDRFRVVANFDINLARKEPWPELGLELEPKDRPPLPWERFEKLHRIPQDIAAKADEPELNPERVPL